MFEMCGGLQLDLFAGPEPTMTTPADSNTTVARMATVVCLKGRRDDPTVRDVIYVGRRMNQGDWQLSGHPLANPYKIGRDGTAEQVVAKYRDWLDRNPRLLARELPKLRGRRLGCWCGEGRPCHARVIADLVNALV